MHGCRPDDPVAPEFGTTDELLVFFWFFLFREAAVAAAAAAAETMQLELVAAVRATIANNENFMLVVVV